MHQSTIFLPLVLLLITAASEASWQDTDGSEDSSPSPDDSSEGSGGHWEDDEDVIPLSAEQRLRDAARFRDELLWDAEREVERARLVPTTPIQPQKADSDSDSDSDSGPDLNSISGPRLKSDVLREVLKASDALSGGHQGVARDDLYFQDGSLLQDDGTNDGGDSDRSGHALNSESPVATRKANVDVAASVANISATQQANDNQQLEAMVKPPTANEEAGQSNSSGAVTSVSVQGVPSEAPPPAADNSSNQLKRTDENFAEDKARVESSENMGSEVSDGEGNEANKGHGEKDAEIVAGGDHTSKKSGRKGIQPETTVSLLPAKNNDPVRETNGISVTDAENAVNSAGEENDVIGEPGAKTSTDNGRQKVEVSKSRELKMQSDGEGQKTRESTEQEQVLTSDEAESGPPSQTQLAQTRSKSTGDGPLLEGTEKPSVITRNPFTAASIPHEANSASSGPKSDLVQMKQSEASPSITKQLENVTAADYLNSDACRSAAANAKLQVKMSNKETEDPASGVRTNINPGDDATASDSYLDSDACRTANLDQIAQDATGQNRDKETGDTGSVNATRPEEKTADADSYLNSDACRDAAVNRRPQDMTRSTGDEKSGSGSPNSTLPGKQAVAEDSYLNSDACRNAASNEKPRDMAATKGEEKTANDDVINQEHSEKDTEANSYLDSDACRNGTPNGKSQETIGNVEKKDSETGDDVNGTNPEKAIAPDSYLNSDACRNAVSAASVPAGLEESAGSKADEGPAAPAVEIVTPKSGRTGGENENDDQATVMPLAAPPTPRISINNKTSSSSSIPSYTNSPGASPPPSASPDLKKSSDPSLNPIKPQNALSDISDTQNSSANLSMPLNSPSDFINPQDPSSNLSEPVIAAALFRHSPVNCQWRCRSLLSNLRLQVDPPRLLVAAGAAVSVQCRLPARQGALTQLSWSFRPAGGGECALTPTEGEGGKKAKPQCDGFGDAAQLYFVNQTVTSSRLAIPHVTAALAGHYTCSARVRCCAGTTDSTPASSRALSTYLHVYGRRQGTNHWAVSVAAGVCLAIGLTAVVALRRRCCRRGKRVPGVSRRYRPVPDGQGTEEDQQEWARLYTGPLGEDVEDGTEMATAAVATATPRRQQFRQSHEATQETALSAPRRHVVVGDDDDDEEEEEHDDCGKARGVRTRKAGLGAAFSSLPETHIARTHAARPAHIRANPLASPQFRDAPPTSGTSVVSPRYEIPLTPPDAPPTPPDAPPKTTMPPKAQTMPPKGTAMPHKGAKMASRRSTQQQRQGTGQTSGSLWRLGAAARQ